MADWHKKYNSCTSCGTEEWPYRSRGLCNKCYPLIIKSERIKLWNKDDLSTIKEIDSYTRAFLIKGNKLEIAKESLIKQINERLNLYRRYNEKGEASGIAIEYSLRAVSRITNNVNNDDFFYGSVTRYNDHFNNDQRRIILKDILLILINRRFHLDTWKDLLDSSS